ncbi:MAG TPA: hypothetical protein RMH85_02675 [Polyangiaceae bacterium LLY-WYZ-15_(1-7)]|nr:hypothetical protein [Sandaracinus sp.]HJL04585.1 hypothetical protein [Polyangiaceae bacterium LLY-WYZ-15_(1-7)]MBJ70787.1 hypothetical protein [Sandaracinus sp.]HJL07367.1 hypothetical protein [Polyangiaceae bacterium LLY-WYZ-15_(1-7)]HJL25001.1 hypothetical protein [Polyangiaceae bacterium LLY-WYZ-15_(1-7)]
MAGPGFDDTSTRDKTIVFWTVLSCVVLLSLIPLFHSYFNSMTDAELEAKVLERDDDGDGEVDYLAERNRTVAEHRALLREAPISIEAAKAQLASRGRNVPVVRPRRNDDLGTAEADAVAALDAVTGWGQLPREEARAEAEEALRRRRAAEEAARQRALELEATEAAAEAEGATPAP